MCLVTYATEIETAAKQQIDTRTRSLAFVARCQKLGGYTKAVIAQ